MRQRPSINSSLVHRNDEAVMSRKIHRRETFTSGVVSRRMVSSIPRPVNVSTALRIGPIQSIAIRPTPDHRTGCSCRIHSRPGRAGHGMERSRHPEWRVPQARVRNAIRRLAGGQAGRSRQTISLPDASFPAKVRTVSGCLECPGEQHRKRVHQQRCWCSSQHLRNVSLQMGP